jgi:hypothetical protein
VPPICPWCVHAPETQQDATAGHAPPCAGAPHKTPEMGVGSRDFVHACAPADAAAYEQAVRGRGRPGAQSRAGRAWCQLDRARNRGPTRAPQLVPASSVRLTATRRVGTETESVAARRRCQPVRATLWGVCDARCCAWWAREAVGVLQLQVVMMMTRALPAHHSCKQCTY